MDSVRIVLEGTPRPTAFCPVSARVERAPSELRDCALMDVAADRTVPFQVEPAAGGATVHWMAESLAAGQQREYVLEPGEEPTRGSVRIEAEEGEPVDVHIGDELVTRYIYGPEVPKPCLYPLIGPFGHGVTRAYPQEEVEGDSTDHVHHRSLYTAWGEVNGSDNWGEGEGSGHMVHRYFDAAESGPVFGRLVALNDWVDDDENRLMQDRVEYRFYNLPSSFRLIDVDVTFYASDGEVEFGDTKEGGILSVRVATPMEVNHTGTIRNAVGGTDEPETWGKRAAWCDYSGIVQGHRVGIAVFDHPSNLRHPTYWHVRNYGLMTANPFGLSFFVDENADGSYTLPGGGRIRFRYRVLVHAGDAAEGDVRRKYLQWIFPPSVEVQQ
ncbi:MAG: PmoA family protein [Planctomycetota bacterium]